MSICFRGIRMYVGHGIYKTTNFQQLPQALHSIRLFLFNSLPSFSIMPSANITTHTPMDKLTAKIAANVTIINNYLKENDLPIPSLERDSPPEFPVPTSERDIHLARLNLIEAAKAMYDLALGPVDMLGWSAMTVSVGWYS